MLVRRPTLTWGNCPSPDQKLVRAHLLEQVINTGGRFVLFYLDIKNKKDQGQSMLAHAIPQPFLHRSVTASARCDPLLQNLGVYGVDRVLSRLRIFLCVELVLIIPCLG